MSTEVETSTTNKHPMNDYYVYIMTNTTNTTLYVGVTNNLQRRVYEHKNELIEGFTQKYHLHKLVFFEMTGSIDAAITREKQLKNWRRQKKEELINSINPEWADLSITYKFDL